MAATLSDHRYRQDGVITIDDRPYRDLWYAVRRSAGKGVNDTALPELTNPSNQVRALTSLKLEESAAVVGPFEAAFQAHIQEWTMKGQPRTARSFSVSTNCSLPMPEDCLLFAGSYLKHAPRQSAHGATFGLIQSSVSTEHPDPGAAHGVACRRPRAATCLMICEPGSEIPIPSSPRHPLISRWHGTTHPAPQDAGEQKDYWRGKAYDHTVKNIVLADRTAQIWFLSDTYEGGVHEKPIADATPYPLPVGSELLKAKGRRFIDAQKTSDQQIGRHRVFIEISSAPSNAE